jgi:hypothetical protein
MAGKLVRVEMGRGRNGKPLYGIPLTALSPAAYQRWQAEQPAPLPHDHVGGASLPRVPAAGRRLATGANSVPQSSTHHAGEPASAGPSRAPRLLEPHSPTLVPLTAAGHVDEAALIALGRTHALAVYHTRLRAVLDLEHAQADAAHGQHGQALLRVAAHLAVNPGTLRRWQSDFRRDGAAALVPQWGKTEGASTVPPALRSELLAAYHTPLSITYAQAFAYGVAWARDRHVAAPSEWAVTRFLKKHAANPQMKTALRKGKKAHADKHRYHMVRNPNELPVNAVWCGDTRTADVHVLMPSGRIARPKLCQFIDISSGRLVGHTIREEMSSEGIAAALRRGMLGWRETDLDGNPVVFAPCVKPQVLYLDNGKDYTGGAMKLDLAPEAAATIFNSLGVHRCLAIPFSPWSKPMEAAFSAMAQDENLLCGYCGRNAQVKPEILKKLAEKGQLLTLAQYAAWYAKWAAERNATHILGHLREHPPLYYYQGVELKLVDPDQLDTLLLRATDRVLTDHGISLPGLGRFMTEDPAVVWLIGQKVEVRYAHDDPSAIYIWHKPSGSRFVLPPVPEGGDYAMIFGGEPSPQFRHAQRVRSTQNALIREAAADVAAAVNPRYIDPTGTWRAAAQSREANQALIADRKERLRLAPPAASGACVLPAAPRPYAREVNALAADPLAAIEAYARNHEGANADATRDQ